MTHQELAALLNGRTYRNEVIRDIHVDALNSGLIIAYGSSDDLLSLVGAMEGGFEDEVGARGGKPIYIDADGSICKRPKPGRVKVQAIWSPKHLPGASWDIQTDAPHSTFLIYDEGEVFCRGIVFERPALWENS